MARTKLKSTNEELEDDVGEAFNVSNSAGNHDASPVFEHGQWWITCHDCGAQWSVVDASGGDSVDGFDFEQVTEGDGYCDEKEDEE